nr:hypothetical protein [Escherichia coli]
MITGRRFLPTAQRSGNQNSSSAPLSEDVISGYQTVTASVILPNPSTITGRERILSDFMNVHQPKRLPQQRKYRRWTS